MNPRSLHVIWCDDIRFEIGNKPSFMGVYAAGLVVASLPAALERLSLWFNAAAPLEAPFRSFGIRVVRDDGTVLLQMPESPVEFQTNDPPPGRTHTFFVAGLPLGRVELPEGCKYLQAIATTDTGEILSQKLWIEVNPQLLASFGVPVQK